MKNIICYKMDKFIPYEVLLKRSLIEDGTFTPQDVLAMSCVCKGMNTYLTEFKPQCCKNGICAWLGMDPVDDWSLPPLWIYNLIISLSNDEPVEVMRLLDQLPEVYTVPQSIHQGSTAIQLILSIEIKLDSTVFGTLK